MAIDLQQKPDTRKKLQEMAVNNGKSVDEVSAMSDDDLVMFCVDVMLAALTDPATGDTTSAAIATGYALSMASGAERASVKKAATADDGPMSEDRKKELMGRFYRPPTAATK